ncbi:MAG: HAMP domain-containing protein [Desulfobacterales bacterium]|nr:HAMP domain-containing protein [Desulfobacterales bacterium]
MAKKKEKRRKGLGLLPKLLLGIFVPILIVFFILWALIFYSFDFGGNRVTGLKDIGAESLRELSTVSVKEAKSSLNRLGEKVIKEKAIDVAAQIEIFIKSHPKMKREDFFKDPWLKGIAVQKVGETGYTAVHDDKGINHFHVNPQIVETDLHNLSGKLPAFWKILEASLKGPASGYYDWKDADGKIRSKYMYLAPVQGTDLIVAATTYIDEFSKPAKAIEGRMKIIEKGYLDAYEMKVEIFYFILLVALVFMLMVAYFYSRSVIRPIRYLSEVADRISMGDLDTPIQIKAKGEVGLLAESIERMQTSVKAAIERLQKRKESK